MGSTQQSNRTHLWIVFRDPGPRRVRTGMLSRRTAHEKKSVTLQGIDSSAASIPTKTALRMKNGRVTVGSCYSTRKEERAR